MPSIGKDRLVFDTANPSVSDNVGSFLRDASGNLLTSTLNGAKQSLDVFNADNFAEDSGHVSGNIGSFILGVRNDASAVLTTTDLDYSPIAVDSAGRLKTVTTVTINSEKAEDSASVSGDIGSFVLAVRKDSDTGSLVTTDGDYAAFTVDATDRLKANVVGSVADSAADSGNPVKIGARAQTGALVSTTIANNDRTDAIADAFRRIYVNNDANIDIAAATTAVDNTAGGVALPASSLAGRNRMVIQNLGAQPVFVGKLGSVTTAIGLRLSPSSSLSIEVGDAVTVAAIAATAGPFDVRTLELA